MELIIMDDIFTSMDTENAKTNELVKRRFDEAMRLNSNQMIRDQARFKKRVYRLDKDHKSEKLGLERSKSTLEKLVQEKTLELKKEKLKYAIC